MGILDKLGFGKLKQGLAKTREGLVGTVTRILTGAPRIDEALLEQLEESLIAGDVGTGTAAEIMTGLRRRLRETPPAEVSGVLPLLQAEVSAQLAGSGPVGGAEPFALPAERPYVILVVGINGVGKTTTIGKLARRYGAAGKKVLIAAADTFRAAAGEQLDIWAKRAGADIVVQKQGEQKVGIDPGQFAEVTTDKVLFEWIPQHAERTGSGRRSKAKKVDETGHRYHGYAVQVLQDGVVIGEAYSHRSLQKAE